MAIDWNNIEVHPIGHVSTDFMFGADGDARNLSTFGNNFSAMSLMAQNRFKWVSDKIEPCDRLSEYIEGLLFWLGQCCLAKEGDIWRVKKCMSAGNYGKLGHPDKFNTCDYDGSNVVIYDYDNPNFIWIKNNAMCMPTFVWLRKYCDRISHIERVMDLNIDAQKTPYIIESTPEIHLSVKNVFKKIRDMSEVIFTNANKGGIRDKVKVLNLNAPYLVDKLYAQKQNEYNDALTLLGINTIDEKRERLITGETEVSSELTENYIDIFYSSRRIAYDTFIEREGVGSLTLKVMKMKGEGAGQNGQLYDKTEGPA